MRPRTVPSFYTFSQMVLLCQSPDPDSATGCRDRAILALLCSAGLRASELCGLRVREGGVHVLRSSAATRWLDQGVSLFHVQQALGHVRIATTARYLGAAVDGLVAAFRRCSVA